MFLLVQLLACIWGWSALPDWFLPARTGSGYPTLPGRAGASFTLLNDGQILVAGGQIDGGRFNDAARYDPVANRWASTEPMPIGRGYHSATLLNDGRVLVSGGSGTRGVILDSADIYDPATDSWSAAGTMGVARRLHASATLADGRVLVVGGEGTLGYRSATATATLYDPKTNSWRAASAPTYERRAATLIRQADGRVLLLGNMDGATQATPGEIYDPANDRWTFAAAPNTYRQYYAAVLLNSGRTLVAGGQITTGRSIATRIRYLSATEIYDPATNQWSQVGSLGTAHAGHGLTLLADGTVLATGGMAGIDRMSKIAERFDPVSGRWRYVASLPIPRSGQAAFQLPDKRVIVLGGASNAEIEETTSAAFYDPADNRWQIGGDPVLDLVARQSNTSVVQPPPATAVRPTAVPTMAPSPTTARATLVPTKTVAIPTSTVGPTTRPTSPTPTSAR